MSYAPTVSLDCLSGAMHLLSKDWGDYGYTIGIESAGFNGAVFLVRCSDGGQFRLVSDRWGNASLPAQCNKGTIGCADENLCHDLCDALVR
jgi:hypothetical protein